MMSMEALIVLKFHNKNHDETRFELDRDFVWKGLGKHGGSASRKCI